MKKTNKKYIIGIIIVVIGIFLIISNFNKESSIKEVNALEQKFNELNNEHSSVCAGPGFIDNKGEKDRLQGACCSAMDFHRYKEQVEGISEIKKGYDKDANRLIPDDPYDIPVFLARELLGYKDAIQLTSEQQQTYDEATKLAHEGGPCCCKCWRWYAFEGQAKYLIAKHSFNSEQIAELWDIQDGCGGKGHAEGEGH